MPSTQVCKLWLRVRLRLSKTLASTFAGAGWGWLAAVGLKCMEVCGFGTRLKQAAWRPKFQSFSERWLQRGLLPWITEGHTHPVVTAVLGILLNPEALLQLKGF